MLSNRGSYRLIIALLIMTAFLLNGCVIKPHKDDQLLEPSQKVKNSSKVEKDEPKKVMSEEDTKVEWTLDECVKYSLKNNEKIKSLALKAKSKKGEMIEAWSDYLPTAHFKYVHGNSKETGESDIFNVSGKMLLWATGKVKSKVKKLKAEQAMLKQEKKEESLEVVYQVKKAFYELLFRQYDVEAKKQGLASSKAGEDDVATRMKNGQAREVDLLGAKASIAHSERELFQATNEYHLAKKRLNHVMGRPLDAEIKLVGELTFKQIPLYREKLIAKALAHNPKLKKLRKGLAKAKYSKEIAHRKNFPNFYLTAFWEYRDTTKEYDLTGGTGPGTKLFQGPAYGIGVEIELPLFRQIGISYGQKKKAKMMIRSLKAKHKNAKREIAYMVESICNKMDEAIRGIHSAKLNAQYRNKMVDVLAKGVDEKVYQRKDLIEGRKKQAEANSMLMKAILNYNVAKAELDKVLGIFDK